jgi:hypothetical protein
MDNDVTHIDTTTVTPSGNSIEVQTQEQPTNHTETEEDRLAMVENYIRYFVRQAPRYARESVRQQLLEKYKIFIKFGKNVNTTDRS